MKKLIACVACLFVIAFALSTWRELAPDTQGTILSAWSELARTVAHLVDSLLA